MPNRFLSLERLRDALGLIFLERSFPVARITRRTFEAVEDDDDRAKSAPEETKSRKLRSAPSDTPSTVSSIRCPKIPHDRGNYRSFERNSGMSPPARRRIRESNLYSIDLQCGRTKHRQAHIPPRKLSFLFSRSRLEGLIAPGRLHGTFPLATSRRHRSLLSNELSTPLHYLTERIRIPK